IGENRRRVNGLERTGDATLAAVAKPRRAAELAVQHHGRVVHMQDIGAELLGRQEHEAMTGLLQATMQHLARRLAARGEAEAQAAQRIGAVQRAVAAQIEVVVAMALDLAGTLAEERQQRELDAALDRLERAPPPASAAELELPAADAGDVRVLHR